MSSLSQCIKQRQTISVSLGVLKIHLLIILLETEKSKIQVLADLVFEEVLPPDGHLLMVTYPSRNQGK